MPSFAGLFSGTPPCQKTAQELAKNGFDFTPVYSLISEDEQWLLVLVEFYKSKKVRGNFYERVKQTYQLFRFKLTTGRYQLNTVQGDCDSHINNEHLAGVLDTNRNLYFLNRRRNTFSIWPPDPNQPIRETSASNIDLKYSAIAAHSDSNTLYAVSDGRIKRTNLGTKLEFESFIRFEQIVPKHHNWNPLLLKIFANRLWVGLISFHREQSLSNQLTLHKYKLNGEHLSAKKMDNSNFWVFHPGPPFFSLEKKSTPEASTLEIKFTDGKPPQVIMNLPPDREILKNTTVSTSGIVRTVSTVDIFDTPRKTKLVLNTYKLGAGQTKTELPLD